MRIEDLTIGQAKELAAMFGGSPNNNQSRYIGQFVIVRTRDAGVHMGTLKSADGRSVTLSDARRLWRWRGANTLNEAAVTGVAKDYTRISESVAEIALLESCEIIPCTDAARKTLEVSQWPA